MTVKKKKPDTLHSMGILRYLDRILHGRCIEFERSFAQLND